MSMYELSESKQKALDKGKRIWQLATSNLFYRQWRADAIENFAFYDGTGQYPQKVREILMQRGQAPVVVNKIKSMINQASGLEINTRTKIAYRSHSGNEEEEQLTKALTHLAFTIQEQQDFSYQGSLKFRDALICGIGWSRLYSHKDKYHYQYTHPLNMVFDADDFSPQLTNMRHCIELHWYALDEIKALWPHLAKRFDQVVSSEEMISNIGNFSSEYFNRRSSFIPSTSNYGGFNGSRLLVNEVLYREPRKYICGYDKKGYYFETFDEELAESIADSKNDLTEDTGTQIMRTVFCNDILLEYGPMFPNLPNMQNFISIPFVWNRRTVDAVPVGWLHDMKDLQREINYRKLRELMSLNSVRAVVDEEAFIGMSAEQIRDELSRPDSILFKSRGTEVNIVPNIDLAAASLRAAERNDQELQQVSGMYSDSLGEATNATSGIAIRQRQIGTSKNLAFGFDGSTLVKKREGQMLLDLIQGSGAENILINVVLDDDEKQAIVLNLVKEEKGKKIVLNDIRTLPVDIYIEHTPNYDSTPEETRGILESLLSNPQGPAILQNPELLKIWVPRHANKIAAAMQQVEQQKVAQQQMMNGGPQASPNMEQGIPNPTKLGVG
jgi:hypothetical protein